MDMGNKKILDFLNYGLDETKILVVGDIMLDGYLFGSVTRISPEAPVPINKISDRKETLGGAANVAHNLARLGCKTYMMGVVGDDDYANKIHQMFADLSIDDSGVIVGRESTTSKIRVLSGYQQMIRLDFEETLPIEEDVQSKLLDILQEKISEGIQAIIISDYNKGVCTPSFVSRVIQYANRMNITVLVDPKGDDWMKYNGANYITPNVKEINDVMGGGISNNNSDLRVAAGRVKTDFAIDKVLVTRSEKGMTLFSDREIEVPTVAKEVYDVSGAGDTVMAMFTAAITGVLSEVEAVNIANFAAGIEVEKKGTYAVSREDLLKKIKN